MNTNEILKQFDEKFPCIEGGDNCNGTIQIGEDDIRQCQFHAEYLIPQRTFLSTSIQQAIAEERARVVELIKSRKPDERKVSTYKTVEARTWYEKNLVIEALDDLLDLLDKPLKDNKDI